MSRRTLSVIAIVILLALLAVPRAEAGGETHRLIFVAPEFLSTEFDKIWVLNTAADHIPQGKLNNRTGEGIAPRGAPTQIYGRGYKVKRLKPGKTAYSCSLADLNSENTDWMATLEQEKRRFVFLTAVTNYRKSRKKDADTVLTLAGYLFDTQRRKLLWHADCTLAEKGRGAGKNAALGAVGGALVLGPVGVLIGSVLGGTREFESMVSVASITLGRMFPKEKKRKKMTVESLMSKVNPAKPKK